MFAYSRSEATVKNIEWLSLIITSHAEAIKKELQKMKTESFIPAPLTGIVGVDEAMKRYDASIKWITEHKHAIIGNGPFEINNYNAAGKVISLTAFRDSSYPFDKGYWSIYENAKLAKFDKVQYPKIIISGEPLNISGNITIGGNSDSNATITYFISDKNNHLITQGMAKWTDKKGNFIITMNEGDTKKMSMGPNELEMFVKSNYALRPDIYRGTFVTVPNTISK
jgi:peptide/nickel transport system substrate-binding protein